MTTPLLKIKVFPKATIKGKMDVRFPAKVETQNFLTVARASGIYTFGIDYTVLTEIPIIDPSTAMLVVLDKTAGIYKLQSVSDLATDLPVNSVTYGQIQQVGANKLLGNPTGSTANVSEVPIGTGIATALGVNVGTAGSPVINGGVLGTPSSGTATNLTGLPISTGVSGLATGVATFLATPSSANLRAALTDETGTGIAYFVSGALGTPASGVATNLTGLPLSTGITGAGTGILTALAVNVGTAGSIVVNGGALGTPSSGVGTNLTGTAAGFTAGHVTTNANLTGDVTSVGNATTLATGNAANLNSGTLLAARMPALTGDVTTTAGAVATTIGANKVTNAMHATMAAFTFKGNNTSGTATPTDVDISLLTAKASPASTDLVIISDQAASGAWKKVSISALASAGSVASIAGNTGAFTLGGLLTNSANLLQVVAVAKSDQTTATSNILAVTPLHQQDHDSAAKATVYFTLSGTTVTVQASYNVTSVTRSGTGTFLITFTTAFASTNYFGVGIAESNTLNLAATSVFTPTKTASAATVGSVNLSGGAPADPQGFGMSFYGRQ